MVEDSPIVFHSVLASLNKEFQIGGTEWNNIGIFMKPC